MEGKEKVLKISVMKIAMIVIALIAVIAILLISNIKKINNSNNVSEIVTNLEEKELTSADTLVQSGTITVHYVNEKGEEIATSIVLEGNVGDWYEVERKEIAHYSPTGEEPITRAGTYTLGNIDIVFVYKPSTKTVKQNVEVEGENDRNGNLIEENLIEVVFDNERIATDYGIKVITKDEKGKNISGGKFKLSKNGEVLKEGEVADGELYVGKIAVKQEGNIDYVLEQTKATVGYRKIEEEINVGIISTWDDTDKKFEIEVKESNNSEVKVNVVNNEIIIEVTNEKYKNEYEVEIVNKSGRDLVSGGKFKVQSNNKTIIEDYTVNGRLNVGTFEVSGDGEDVYTFSEVETAEGYKTIISSDNPGKVKVTKKFNEELNKYDISVEYNKIEGFTAEVAKNGKVTIYVETELLVDKYDLCMKKFVSKVDDEDMLDREPIVILDEDEIEKTEVVNSSKNEIQGTEDDEIKRKFIYSQDNEIIKVCNNQEVTYTLRIYNESDVIAKGKRVIEYIPEGLVFIPENEVNIDNGWKLYKEEEENLVEVSDIKEATIVATDCLVDKEIAVYENEQSANYIDAKVVFKVDETKITTESRIIENKVKIEKNENDDNTENDESTEKIYVKYFDLDITKYIKEVKVKNNNTGTESYKELGIDRKNELVKIDVANTDIDNTVITVTYGLEVKNIGEIEGYATELVDYIPTDFKLVQDGNWKEKNGKAVSTKLENKLLKPGEKAVIEVTFEWDLAEDKIGSRVNEAKITEYENQYDAKDPTEDNNDKEEMIVTVRTGEILYFVIPVIIVIATVVVAVVIYKVKVKHE